DRLTQRVCCEVDRAALAMPPRRLHLIRHGAPGARALRPRRRAPRLGRSSGARRDSRAAQRQPRLDREKAASAPPEERRRRRSTSDAEVGVAAGFRRSYLRAYLGRHADGVAWSLALAQDPGPVQAVFAG